MKYTVFRFVVEGNLSSESDRETVYDVLAAELGEVGFDSFEVVSDALLAYIPTALIDEGAVALALEAMPFDTLEYSYTTEEVPEVNWNEEWEKNYFKPIVLGDGLCVIRAPFHTDYPKACTEVLIQPKMAFGTGNHDTTALIISYLLEIEMAGLRVLDMGAGTGILGILALKQGAKSLTAIDIDEWAYLNILENAELNGVSPECAMQGDASSLLAFEPFDLILANITRNILYEDMPHYVSVLRAGGRIVFSGFYEEDVAVLRERGEALGLCFASSRVSNRWAMLEMFRPLD